MKIAYFDPIGGASGDMIVASLLASGLGMDALRKELSKLALEGYSVDSSEVAPHAVASTRFHVRVDPEPATEHDAKHHHHAHSHEHHGRRLNDIRRIIEGSALSAKAKENSLAVFQALGEAEAKVHATTIDNIHFHEVGAVDSIVDIVGACAALDLLGVERLYVAPLPLSYGMVECEHGTWPVPGPATTELLRGFSWRNTDIEGELVTPTAAAIFATLGETSRTMPEMSISHVGYGAGQNDYGIPNVLRVCIGETVQAGAAGESSGVTVIETSLDDQNAELLDHTMSCLFAGGALDVWFTPIQMKKNRPAVMLTVLAPPSKAQELAHIILRETSTLGVRFWTAGRICMEREIRAVHTSAGEVRVKVGKLDDGNVKISPEYDDIKRLAEETGRPARDIYLEALLEASKA